MVRFNVFGDDRKIPRLSVNIKVKVKYDTQEDLLNWNLVFGYIMKKPRTKLEFISASILRDLGLSSLKVRDLEGHVSETDYEQLLKIENIFNNHLSVDVKAFILAVLKVSYSSLNEIINKS